VLAVTLATSAHKKQQEPSETGAGAPAMLATIGSSWDCRTSDELTSYLFFNGKQEELTSCIVVEGKSLQWQVPGSENREETEKTLAG
jgi:hypothetical protein